MDIEKVFEDLGLSQYQARALAAIIQCGEAKASDISRLSGVPRSKIYSVLDQLVNLGLIDKKPGRPIRYKSKKPDEIMERLEYNIEMEYRKRLEMFREVRSDLMDLLNRIYKPAEVESKELVRIVRVGDASIRETKLMYLEAKREIDIISKVFEYYPSVREELIKASGRGVRVRVILLGKRFLSGYSDDVQNRIIRSLREDIEGVEIRLSNGVLPLRGAIIDPSYEYRTGKAIFVVEDIRTPLYLRDAVITENPSLVAGMKKYFDLIWKYESSCIDPERMD